MLKEFALIPVPASLENHIVEDDTRVDGINHDVFVPKIPKVSENMPRRNQNHERLLYVLSEPLLCAVEMSLLWNDGLRNRINRVAPFRVNIILKKVTQFALLVFTVYVKFGTKSTSRKTSLQFLTIKVQ